MTPVRLPEYWEKVEKDVREVTGGTLQVEVIRFKFASRMSGLLERQCGVDLDVEKVDYEEAAGSLS